MFKSKKGFAIVCQRVAQIWMFSHGGGGGTEMYRYNKAPFSPLNFEEKIHFLKESKCQSKLFSLMHGCFNRTTARLQSIAALTCFHIGVAENDRQHAGFQLSTQVKLCTAARPCRCFIVSMALRFPL